MNKFRSISIQKIKVPSRVSQWASVGDVADGGDCGEVRRRESIAGAGSANPALERQRERSHLHTRLALVFLQTLWAPYDSLSVWGPGCSRGRDMPRSRWPAPGLVAAPSPWVPPFPPRLLSGDSGARDGGGGRTETNPQWHGREVRGVQGPWALEDEWGGDTGAR